MKKYIYAFPLMLYVCICLSACASVSYSDFRESMNDESKSIDYEPYNEEKIEKIYSDNNQAAIENAERSHDLIEKKAEKSFNEILRQYGDIENDKKVEGMSPGKIILMFFYNFYSTIRMNSPVISAVCFILGMFIWLFTKGNKKFKKFGLCMALLVPVILIASVFLIGALNNLFLYN